MVKQYGFNHETCNQVREELVRALQCVTRGENYAGAFVTTILCPKSEDSEG
jgi:hypothetical protein